MDIVDRLKRGPSSYVCIRREAAQEIEALRKRIAVMEPVVNAAVIYCGAGQPDGGQKLLDAIAALKETSHD